MLGQLLDGRYRIIQILGVGGFGRTYIAEDTKLYNTRCVVKQLKPLVTDPRTLQVARRLFDSEAEILHRLGSHDQIPRLLAHFEENQEFYLVQELIEGHLLSDELTHRKRLSEPYVIALLQSSLTALAFVHQNSIIHRDIKPTNLIRRQQDGKIVLIDFGAVKQIVTQLVNAQGQTRMTVTIGTPGYMPSEQSRGSPRLSSDIYAVGIIGIQALTGLMPDQLLEDPDTAEIIWRNQVQVSPQLADVLDTMVRYDFRQRYSCATEALLAVQQLANPYTPAPQATVTGYTPTQAATTPGYTPTIEPITPQPPVSPPSPPQSSLARQQTSPDSAVNTFPSRIKTQLPFPVSAGRPWGMLLGLVLLLGLPGVLAYVLLPRSWVAPLISRVTNQGEEPEATSSAPQPASPAPVASPTSSPEGASPVEVGRLIQAIASNPKNSEGQAIRLVLRRGFTLENNEILGFIPAGSVLQVINELPAQQWLQLRVCSPGTGNSQAQQSAPPKPSAGGTQSQIRKSPAPPQSKSAVVSYSPVEQGVSGWIRKGDIELNINPNFTPTPAQQSECAALTPYPVSPPTPNVPQSP